MGPEPEPTKVVPEQGSLVRLSASSQLVRQSFQMSDHSFLTKLISRYTCCSCCPLLHKLYGSGYVYFFVCVCVLTSSHTMYMCITVV